MGGAIWQKQTKKYSIKAPTAPFELGRLATWLNIKVMASERNHAGPAPTQFECSVCADDREEVTIIIDSSPVCSECVTTDIVPKFYAALEFETNYPVEWAEGIPLDPRDFSGYFENFGKFIEAWEKKEEEYKMPVKDRLYCRHLDCGNFLMRRLEVPRGEVIQYTSCLACRNYICKRCGLSRHPDSLEVCRTKLQEDKDEEDPIKGMKGYQRCPGDNCGLVSELKDGCNVVVCTACRLRWCWICRTRSPPREHWNAGMPCPRFNKPGAKNALWNDRVRDDDILEEELTDRAGRALAEELLGGIDEQMAADIRDLQTLPPLEDAELTSLPRESADAKRIRLLKNELMWSEYRASSFYVAVHDRTEREVTYLRHTADKVIAIYKRTSARLPEWLGMAIDILDHLRTATLMLYSRRRSAVVNFKHYHHCHLAIQRMLPAVIRNADVKAHFPKLERILILYMIIAPTRLAEAWEAAGRARLL
ncbi:hypothetical protein LTR37_020723 [Vermiconidia calcicola]|uniref:Uncharacterized protein n=1 Tax=Vermiconidia calcicola TaxID=1690605 RepID=A0ACC3MAG9_9PEZI|nr:hypothetical protein LTR37_020723 [Vermiconidia calcicola]